MELTGYAADSIMFGHLAVRAALARIPAPNGERFIELFRHDTLSIELYAPRGVDPQLLHSRNEVYIVVTGGGQFVIAGETQPFGPGDVLFVPAGVEHRFVDFTDDLAVWVIFYGPEGGGSALAYCAS